MPSLDFKGKQFIYGHHLTVPISTIEIDADKSFTGENDPSLNDNLIIHGDNLYALKALLPKYAGKIKCIYIDPPYNTGNENWVYNDNVNSPIMQAWLEKHSPIDNEDLERHDKWLCMMWPRLHLLRELLSDDGVIFISIDDNEQHRLRMLMDEIFGEQNFVECLIWKKKGGAGNTEKLVGDIVEYVLMYTRNIKQLSTNRRNIENIKYSQRDEEGSYKLEGLLKTDEGMYKRETMKYPVPVPDTDEVARPPEGKRWTVGEITMMDLLQAQLLHFTPSKFGWVVKQKKYFDETDPETGVYLNLLLEQGSLKVAKGEMVSLGFTREAFSTPKPLVLVKRLLRMICKPDDIILDSFAGTGTTAHAVLALNKEDGGNRKFILMECEDYADTITAERVRRVINGVENAKDETLRKGFGGSFTYCTLGEPIDEEGMLTGENLPTYEALADYIAYTATGNALTAISEQEDYCFGETDDLRFYLIYEPTLQFLESNKSALDGGRAEQIAKACKETGKKAYVYAPQKFVSQKELTDMGITFCQLPYNIHRIAE